MTISVSSSKRMSSSQLSVREGQHVEFKTSAFYSPERSKYRQVETIAREIVSFMNADGGELYLGVRDDGFVSGIQNDLEALSKGLDETIVRGPGLDDSSWVDVTKVANHDTYARKINQIVQGCLGKSACQYLGDVDFQQTSDGFVYARIPVMRAAKGEVVLFQSGRWSELWVRTQGRMQRFDDKDRDKFVAQRVREHAAGELEIYRERTEKIWERMEALSRNQTQAGYAVAGAWEKFEVGCEKTALNAVDNNARSENGQCEIEQLAVDEEKEAAIRLREINEATVRAKEEARLLMERVKQKRADRSPIATLRHGYDLRSSSTSVMDEFDMKENGQFKYSRLVLYHYDKGLTFIPYDYNCDRDNRYEIIRFGDGYRRYPHCDFKISKVELVIERCVSSDERLTGNGFSFSDLKKGLSGGLAVAIWNSIDQSIIDAKPVLSTDAEKLTLSLKHPIEFRAHTSDSYDRQAINNPRRYKVVGVRFIKEKLFFCPERLTNDEHAEFDQLEADAFMKELKRIMDTASTRGT